MITLKFFLNTMTVFSLIIVGFIKPSFAQDNTCVLGTFDGSNCYVGPKPKTGFIFKEKYFYMKYDQCSSGQDDGLNCMLNEAPAGTKAFVYSGGFFTKPLPNNQCVLGTFDGSNCYVGPKPKTGFIFKEKYFYMKYDQCSSGQNDGLNCLLNKAPAGTKAFVYGNGFFTTSKSKPPTPTPTPTNPRSISVSSEGSGQSTLFAIHGNGFTPNSRVVIRITDPQLRQIQISETAEESGKFVARRASPCVSGVRLTVTAFEDANPAGTFANSVVKSCP